MRYRSFSPEQLTPQQRHHYILGSINPRPICFASTVDAQGRPNLAPYSFFNVFSSSPPIMIFSVNTRRDGSNKDTLNNVKATGEVVINLVNYPMARQMAICGVEYDTGINEFDKGGFTPLPSLAVKPFRVKESPVHYECKVIEVRSLGAEGGAANLIIARAVLIHMDEKIFNEKAFVDPQQIDMVGRLGNFNYCRASGDSVFEIRQPPAEIALGFDNLPPDLKTSGILTGHHLAMLAGTNSIPSREELASYPRKDEIARLIQEISPKEQLPEDSLHSILKRILDQEEIRHAWMVYLAAKQPD